MNIKHLIAASAFALVGASAFADGPQRTEPFVSTMTRAQVQADLASAQASGELAQLRVQYNDFGTAAVMASAMPRNVAEVRAEAIAVASTRTLERAYAGS
jgi:hypothetical protein